MAGPAYGAAGAQLASGTDSTAQIPVPASVVSGSVVLVCLFRGADSNPAYEAVTPAAGFSVVPDNPGDADNSADSHGFFCDVFWHRASGNESGTYDFTFPSRFRVGFAVRVDGCRASGPPFEVDDGARSTTSDPKSATTPAVSNTTTAADRLLVWAGWSWTTGAWTQPSGFTARVTNTPFDLITLSTKDQAAAGAAGSLTGTQSSESHAAWVGAFVADGGEVSGLLAASLGGLTARLVAAREGGGGSADALLDIYYQAQAMAAEDAQLRLQSCPNDGTPYRTGPRGELYCPFCSWRPDN